MDMVFDAGNSRIDGAVFDGAALLLRFEFDAKRAWTCDEFGLLLRALLRERGIALNAISRIGVCSVVAVQTQLLRQVAVDWLGMAAFVADPQSAAELQIAYRDPQQLGMDRIVNAVAALALYPGRDLILVDAGTATTLCAVSRHGEHLGGAILPGIGMAAHALRQHTNSLPLVQINGMPEPVGLTTADNIAAGLFYGQLGAIRELIQHTGRAVFAHSESLVIATGGAAGLFAQANVFHAIRPELTLIGTRLLLDRHSNAVHG